MNTIKLLGIEGAEYKRLRNQLKKVLSQMKLTPTIEEINDIDSILRYRVSYVPTIMVGSKELAIEGNSAKIEEIKNYIQDYLKENNRMKQILVPTDFSETAHAAYRYARALASKLNASLKVVHVSAGSFNMDDMPVLEAGKGRKEVLEDRLKTFCEYVPEESTGAVMTEVEVSYEAIQALNIANKIVKLSSEADLLVMGASGEHDIIDKLFGSMSSKVAQNAKCPVLLVPRGLEFKGLSRILYASNWESVQPGLIQQVTKFGSFFGSGFDFVHIDEGQERDDYQEMEEAIFNTLFEDKEPAFRFSCLKGENTAPIQGLYQFADQYAIDLVVLVNRQDGFLENVMKKSMTKEMAIKARYPVLVYQSEMA